MMGILARFFPSKGQRPASCLDCRHYTLAEDNCHTCFHPRVGSFPTEVAWDLWCGGNLFEENPDSDRELGGQM